MALDAAMIRVAAEELNRTIQGGRVEKIYMPSRDEAVLTVRTREDKYSLFLSARSGGARVHITREEFEYPTVPPTFCMLLRKHLTGARITSVDTIEGDRVMLFHFDGISEMGDRVQPMVSVEMMGRYSNIVLVSGEGIVIDAVKRIDESQSDKRQLMPGLPFSEPPKPDKLSFFSTDAETIVREIRKSPRLPADAVLTAVSGLSPMLCREIACGVDDVPGNELGDSDAGLLETNIIAIKEAIQDPLRRNYNIVYDKGNPFEFSFITLKQYSGLESRSFDSVSALFDSFYSDKERLERMKMRSQDLTKQIKQLIDRNSRKQEARRSELAATSKADGKRLYGELLTANLHCFGKGDKNVTVCNYYTGENVTIPLDVTRTPNENAQKYYKEYRKLHTAAEMLGSLIEEGEREGQYLLQVQHEINMAVTEEEFMDIRKELKDAGYLKGFKYKDKGKHRSDPYLHYMTSGGFEVTVGRNNIANEKLTLKTADNRDIWFHVKDAAGSHVVLKTDGRHPDDSSMTEACEIAAYNSSVQNGQLVPVDYTEVRRVHKIPGGRVGMVTYTDQKTAYVTPEKEKVEALRISRKNK